MPTPGSPRSMRIKVGTETPRRLAHARWDSRRLTLATARFSPRPRSAWAAAGGIVSRAWELFGITKSLSIRSNWSSLYYLKHQYEARHPEAPKVPLGGRADHDA